MHNIGTLRAWTTRVVVGAAAAVPDSGMGGWRGEARKRGQVALNAASIKTDASGPPASTCFHRRSGR